MNSWIIYSRNDLQGVLLCVLTVLEVVAQALHSVSLPGGRGVRCCSTMDVSSAIISLSAAPPPGWRYRPSPGRSWFSSAGGPVSSCPPVITDHSPLIRGLFLFLFFPFCSGDILQSRRPPRTQLQPLSCLRASERAAPL